MNTMHGVRRRHTSGSWPSQTSVSDQTGRRSSRFRRGVQTLVWHLHSVLARTLWTAFTALVIRLAIDTDLTEVLPAAFYELQKWYPPGPARAIDGISVQPVTVDDNLLRPEELKAFFHAMHMWATNFYLSVMSAKTATKPADCAIWDGDRSVCRQKVRNWANSQLLFSLQRFSGVPRDPINFLRPPEKELRFGDLDNSTCIPWSFVPARAYQGPQFKSAKLVKLRFGAITTAIRRNCGKRSPRSLYREGLEWTFLPGDLIEARSLQLTHTFLILTAYSTRIKCRLNTGDWPDNFISSR